MSKFSKRDGGNTTLTNNANKEIFKYWHGVVQFVPLKISIENYIEYATAIFADDCTCTNLEKLIKSRPGSYVANNGGMPLLYIMPEKE